MPTRGHEVLTTKNVVTIVRDFECSVRCAACEGSTELLWSGALDRKRGWGVIAGGGAHEEIHVS